MDYDKKILRKLQLTQLEILKDIDKFCKQNNIQYFLAYGTALGAFRHGGFIPWDDDIDIFMERSEYDRFLALAEKKMARKYDVLTMQKTRGYVSVFAKLSKKGTKFEEATNTNPRYQQGIFVDIFPYDYMSNNKKQREKNFKRAWFWGKVCILCEISDPILPYGISSLKRNIAKFGCKMVHGLLWFIRLNKQKAYKKYLKYATMCNNNPDRKCLAYFAGLNPKGTIILKKDLYPAKEILFEGCEFFIPNNIEAYLASAFGNDYMTLPPVEERHNHMAKELIFGDEDEINCEQ